MISLHSQREKVAAQLQPRPRPKRLLYLQAGKPAAWPGGWQSAPGSCGPLFELPGPKSGSANAVAGIASAAVATINAPSFFTVWPPPAL